MKVIGIDPGAKGALAVIDLNELSVDVHDLPATIRGRHDLIAGLPPIRVAGIEKPFCGPQMGRRTLATMYQNYGVLLGALAWRDIPAHEVPPKTWKGAMNLDRGKLASVEKAHQLFPAQADQIKRHDHAEAVLIAHYARRWVR